MDFINKVSALLPFGRKEETLEYYFALNISSENLEAALWTIKGKELKIAETASSKYSTEELTQVADRLLDQVLGNREIVPSKILFGVPDGWLSDENLKEEYLRLLRSLVKDLELTPMAYVATSHAIIHFLEKQDGVPTTAILVGFEEKHLEVIVVRAGKLDGAKTFPRGDNSGIDIEKALLTFSDVETLPSKILLYGADQQVLEKLKGQLVVFPWMAKLSFLHFPKIEILEEDLEVKSVCFAGATEIREDAIYVSAPITTPVTKSLEGLDEEEELPTSTSLVSQDKEEPSNFGFITGDVSEVSESVGQKEQSETPTHRPTDIPEEVGDLDEEGITEQEVSEAEDFTPAPSAPVASSVAAPAIFKNLPRFPLPKFFPRKLIINPIFLSTIGVVVILISAYLFLVKAEVKVFVEPQVLERDSQVTADPSQKEVDQDKKIIPGQVVTTEVSGTQKAEATGKKQIGDPAKGTVNIYNKTNDEKTFSKGTTLAGPNNLKFTLDSSVTIASQSATTRGITFGNAKASVTAQAVGADGNIPSGSELTVSNASNSEVSAEAEGNFSGGTSQEVTVVSDADQKRLLAALASDLRKQAREKLQEQLPGKKILEEGLSEEIVRKSYNKNVNDQASELSLNLTARYKGTAFDEKDLKMIVSTLVTTDVPGDFELDLAQTETQADVSKLEKDGRLIFLARFKAKLLPKLDTDKIKKDIKGKTATSANELLKGYKGVLGSAITISPSLPNFLQLLPILEKNINVSVGLK